LHNPIWRQENAGRETIEAISVSSNTTGRAVFYAGINVLVPLATVPFASGSFDGILEPSTNVK
jgi:hypothetical protein|tara:strand:- start:759 stop:947 length:189 start_codon:yes stop_codon:yes gene_type:complete